MRAEKGDHVTVHGRIVGQHDQVGEVVEVLGDNGEPPFRVRFEDGHEGVLSPGPDCTVEHHQRK